MSQEVLRCFAQNAIESVAMFCANFGRRVYDFTGKNYFSVLIGAVFLSLNYKIQFAVCSNFMTLPATVSNWPKWTTQFCGL